MKRNQEPLNPAYTEILRLSEMLTRAGIGHVVETLFDGWHIVYGTEHGTVCSVIEHRFSYGQEADRLEIKGLLDEHELVIFGDVVGWLTAEDVFERIKAHHEGRR